MFLRTIHPLWLYYISKLLDILYANQISKFQNIHFVLAISFESRASKFGNIFSYINVGKPQSVYHITYIKKK